MYNFPLSGQFLRKPQRLSTRILDSRPKKRQEKTSRNAIQRKSECRFRTMAQRKNGT